MKNLRTKQSTLLFWRVLYSGILAILVSGCAIFQPGGRPSNPVAALRYDIDRILADTIFIPARASIKIVSLDSKETLYERDSRLLVRPASNMKLLTSSAALQTLGTGYRFRTSVSVDSIGPDSTVEGNLYIKGYGDPDLVTSDLDTLARQVQSAGVKAVCGAITADDSFFDDLTWGYGWNWDDEPSSYAAYITPLAVNDNCVNVQVTPGLRAGDSVTVAVDPPTSYISVINHATTVADTVRNHLVVTRLFREHLNTLLIEGEMLAGAKPVERQLSVWRPELYAATLFEEALQRHGVEVRGGVLSGTTPPGALEIATYSRAIDSTIINLMKVSDNLTAEMLLKILGTLENGPPGSAQGGVYAVHRFLSTMGIDTTKFFMADGSGLSFYDLVTADMIVQILQGMAAKPDLYPLFYEALPIAGVDGTLSNRMRGTSAEGNLRGKTGTISGVSSLSGYVRTVDGEHLAFAMTMQNFIFPSRYYQRVQDKIGALLAGFSRTGRVVSPQP